MSDRWPIIAEVEKQVADQREQAIRVIRATQDDCTHEKIVADSDFGGRRICAQCGLEEVNRYYSWPGYTSEGGLYEFVREPNQPTILNTEFFKRDDVIKYRVRI